MRRQHLPDCVEVLRAVHGSDGYPTWWPPDPVGWLSPPGCAAAWVAVDDDDGEVLGHVCVVLGVDDPVVSATTGVPAERLAGVSRLFTAPAVRGRGLGVGTRLLTAVQVWARQRGLRLMLDVVDDGAPPSTSTNTSRGGSSTSAMPTGRLPEVTATACGWTSHPSCRRNQAEVRALRRPAPWRAAVLDAPSGPDPALLPHGRGV